MNEERDNRCEQCEFHKSLGENRGSLCRRFPPVMGEGGWASFPKIGWIGWCGEFKRKATE